MKKPIIAIILLIILLSVFLLSAGCSDSSTENTSTSYATTPASSATPQSIFMTTDRTQYARGEMVKIKIANNLDVPVWYIGYSQQDLVFWEIEKVQGNNWVGLTIRLPMIEDGREVCRLILYERPVGNVTELKPHSDLLYEWNQQICSFEAMPDSAEP